MERSVLVHQPSIEAFILLTHPYNPHRDFNSRTSFNNKDKPNKHKRVARADFGTPTNIKCEGRL